MADHQRCEHSYPCRHGRRDTGDDRDLAPCQPQRGIRFCDRQHKSRVSVAEREIALDRQWWTKKVVIGAGELYRGRYAERFDLTAEAPGIFPRGSEHHANSG